jgi:hypothetical protein
MSFLSRGNGRGRRGVALVVTGALMVFQALVIVMAPAASAAVTCSFSSGAITINATADEEVEVG